MATNTQSLELHIDAGSQSSTTTDYISISDAAQTGLDLADTNAATIMGWIYLASGVGNDQRVLISKGGASVGYYYHVDTTFSPDRHCFTFEDSEDSGYSAHVLGDVSKDAWHHIAVTRDGTDVEFYLDGSSIGTDSVATDLNFIDNSGSVKVGCLPGPNALFGWWQWEGYIDEVAVFGRALSSAEIEGYYNSIIPSGLQGLRLLLRMEGDLTDSSPYGNDFSFVNDATLSTEHPTIYTFSNVRAIPPRLAAGGVKFVNA